jgi:hypothetical protein
MKGRFIRDLELNRGTTPIDKNSLDTQPLSNEIATVSIKMSNHSLQTSSIPLPTPNQPDKSSTTEKLQNINV